MKIKNYKQNKEIINPTKTLEKPTSSNRTNKLNNLNLTKLLEQKENQQNY